VLAWLILGAWVATVALGLSLLVRWPGRPRTAYVHLATATVGLAAWVCYLAADRPGWLAWAVFAWLNVVNGLGDTLMVIGSRRGTARPKRGPVRTYLDAVGDLLRGREPSRIAHALLAPAVYFPVLLVALGV
jgi:hypothetical protein